jgi:hypothetical protein
MLLVDQTLTSLELERVLDQANLQKSSVKPASLKGEAKDPRVPTGSQAVSRTDTGWGPRSVADKWARHHFIHLTIEDLKRARVKTLNYSQVMAVQQGSDESPMTWE